MLDEIKAYWYRLKKEYENKYNRPFLKDFEESKEYLEKMESYLLERQEEYPSDVDVICTLASVQLELRCGDSNYIELLESFLNRFSDTLDDSEKARIYTNIAFCNDYSKLALEYLMRAEELKSPFAETYAGLGLYYFAEYEFCRDEKNILLSKKYFEIARDMDESYEYSFNYAVSLYELKKYENAKKIFLDLLRKYPNRMRLMLCIAYCEAYLGNKEKAIYYLQQVKVGQDDNYSLDTNVIEEYEIFDVYYMLDEYDKFLTYCNEAVECNCYTADWEQYYYVLWQKNEKKKFAELEEKNRSYFEKMIAEAISDDYYDSEEEKKETIADWENDKRKFEEMISRIKEDVSKPELQLSLYPEYVCFMVDCVRHQF
ncbi:tetratricopeptide repeat protein [Filifactor alocis]